LLFILNSLTQSNMIPIIKAKKPGPGKKPQGIDEIPIPTSINSFPV